MVIFGTVKEKEIFEVKKLHLKGMTFASIKNRIISGKSAIMVVYATVI